MELHIPASWRGLLDEEGFLPVFRRAQAAYAAATVYPPQEEVFTALQLTSPDQVRVVILGQDPYHEPDQAHGLAFSVRKGVKLPPSLVNIYKERENDLKIPPSVDGDLSDWARQGVLLLNTVLTVERGKANSHRTFGWQSFTDYVVAQLAELPQPIAFILWGSQAQKKAASAAASSYPRLILQSPHPSPLSAYRGFFGSCPFSRVNEFLAEHNEPEIHW